MHYSHWKCISAACLSPSPPPPHVSSAAGAVEGEEAVEAGVRRPWREAHRGQCGGAPHRHHALHPTWSRGGGLPPPRPRPTGAGLWHATGRRATWLTGTSSARARSCTVVRSITSRTPGVARTCARTSGSRPVRHRMVGSSAGLRSASPPFGTLMRCRCPAAAGRLGCRVGQRGRRVESGSLITEFTLGGGSPVMEFVENGSARTLL